MDIRLIAIDLDGTALNSKREIPEQNLQALQNAMAQDILVVPATGRVLSSVDTRILALEGIRYLICSNGAAVFDRKKGCILYENLMPAKTAKRVLDALEGEDICYDVYLNGKAYTTKYAYDHLEDFGIFKARIDHVRKTRTPYENLTEFVINSGCDVEKINLIFKDSTVQKRICGQISLIEDVILTCSVPDIVDVNFAGTNKGDALSHLCGLLHLPKESVMAVGDGGNDIEMLDFAGCSVAMENAQEWVKAHAQYITDTNDNCGLQKAIETSALCGLNQNTDKKENQTSFCL